MTFDQFFKTATGIATGPFDYQRRLACGERGERSEPEWLRNGTQCQARLIDIPTGLGKTAAVVLAWLWNRAERDDDRWPRRLIYCLPMRTLVEQTRENVGQWLKNLGDREWDGKGDHSGKIGVHILMGGEERETNPWDLHPERHAILIGTQDMLLSRALNRGYGMSRYRWPMHFGLLNNDALWVMDETQLMGSGVWTSAQLDWMRERRFKPLFSVKTWWMSATLGGAFLHTSDRQREKMPEPPPVRISNGENEHLPILQALRPVQMLEFKGAQKKEEDAALLEIAGRVAERHLSGTLSMIVCNRVAYAQALHEMIEANSPESHPQVVLLHSRFRPDDRKDSLDAVLAFEAARKADEDHPGLVLVSTQVVEAGFDVSSTRLWTQLTPWASLIQRLGRLNRDGKSNREAQAFVFELPIDKKDPLPYEKSDIDAARKIVVALEKLCAALPDRPIRELLAELATGPMAKLVEQALEPKPEPYPRAMDVHGLFSTEPDVFGGFTDISPWVRNAKANADVTVFWRDFEDSEKAANERDDGPPFRREEGCPVAVFRLRGLLGASRHAYQWNPKSQRWDGIAPGDIRPGMTLLLPGSAGGYDKLRGWTGEKGGDLGELLPPGPFSQRDEEDPESEIDQGWVTLETHLADAEKFADELAIALPMEGVDDLRRCLVRAAGLHDIGKSLAQWQQKLLELHEAQDSEMAQTLWAKAPKVKKRRFLPGLRHEAASALAMWSRYYREDAGDFPALAIYLVAAHHGKARTVLAARSSVAVPNVCGIPKPDGLGEGFPSAPLPWPAGWQMDFSAAEDGASGAFTDDGAFTFEAPGWSGLVADLLGGWEATAPARTCGAVPEDEPAAFGPFALAYLESFLRAVDGRASEAPSSVHRRRVE